METVRVVQKKSNIVILSSMSRMRVGTRVAVKRGDGSVRVAEILKPDRRYLSKSLERRGYILVRTGGNRLARVNVRRSTWPLSHVRPPIGSRIDLTGDNSLTSFNDHHRRKGGIDLPITRDWRGAKHTHYLGGYDCVAYQNRTALATVPKIGLDIAPTLPPTQPESFESSVVEIKSISDLSALNWSSGDILLLDFDDTSLCNCANGNAATDVWVPLESNDRLAAVLCELEPRILAAFGFTARPPSYNAQVQQTLQKNSVLLTDQRRMGLPGAFSITESLLPDPVIKRPAEARATQMVDSVFYGHFRTAEERIAWGGMGKGGMLVALVNVLPKSVRDTVTRIRLVDDSLKNLETAYYAGKAVGIHVQPILYKGTLCKLSQCKS